MKCIICDNPASDEHHLEVVSYDGKDYDVASAVIASDKQGFLCLYHEKIMLELAAKARRQRAEQELTDV